ncbi:Low-temperature-induced 65 kDa protein [Spatholobus suberectus]|nr:Low-temperature-induced 65 kDa protein [Spatholobus suberectus]
MDSRVVQNQVNENDEHYPHLDASQQVTHGEEELHFDREKKSVLNKAKAKAKKIKDTIKKHGRQVLDRGSECNNEDQHTLDDHDLDEDEDTHEDPQVHETPVHESEDVKTTTPTSEQVENLGKSGIDFGGTTGTTVMGEEPRHDALLGDVSSTTEIDQNTATEPAKTFSVEERAGLPKDNLERSIGLDLEEEPHATGSRPEAYTPPNYHTKVTDPSGVGKDEIEITPVEESFARMNVHDEPKPTPEINVQPTFVDPARSHDQFVPHLSAAAQTQYPSAERHDQFNQETISTNMNRNPAESGLSFNTITTTVEEQPLYEVNTDKVVSPKDVIAFEVGSGENDDIKDKVVTNEEQQKSGDASNMSGSTAQYGKNIAHSLTQKLAPVYEKVAGVGSAVKSKVTGTSTGGVGTETKDVVKEQDQDKGVSVKDYLAEKLRPGEEDKALSEVISEALHKRKEVPVEKEDGNMDGGDEKMCEESSVNSPGKGVVDKLKGVVGTWFGKSEEKVAGGEDLSKNTNSGAEVERVNQVGGEIKSSPIEGQGTR